MPCPQGVNIPQNFACLNNVSLETSRIRRFFAKRNYGKLANSKSKLDLENPNGNSTFCSSCGNCISKCPQNIAIPTKLQEVNKILGKRRLIV